jgi:hypothetical protein
MTKRALIVRSGYRPLDAFANSAACITQALRARGFKTIPCEDADATRAGILRAYDELIESATSEDAIALYYVGHGGLIPNRSYTPDGDLPPYIQHICPTDFAQTTDDDFRGISALELSLQLAALTCKTRNVTVILECCFASQMSRGDSQSVEQVPPVLTRLGLASHFRRIRKRYPDLRQLSPSGNRDAVRVAATGQVGSAWNVAVPPASDLQAIGIDLPDGGWVGAMTLGLVQILAAVDEARVTWRSIGEGLRAQVYTQRPEIEGPVDRVPFSLDTIATATFGVHAEREHTVAVVDAGRLLGVSVGDVYGVMPAGATRLDPALQIAEITMDEATAIDSRSFRIDWRAGYTALPANAVAIPRTLAFDRYPVRVVSEDGALSVITAALDRACRIRAATAEDRDPLAELRVHGDTLELHDPLGPLFPPALYPGGLHDAVQDLENLAAARRLRVMADEQGIAHEGVAVDLVVVDAAGGHRLLAHHGAALGLGDRLAVRLENRTDAPLYSHVFNIGLRGRISMLSDPGGIRLMPSTPAYCGSVATGRLVGFKLRWATGLPTDRPRTDSVMVIVTQGPADLGALATKEHLARSAPLVAPRQVLLDAAARGASRSRGDEPAPATTPFAMYWRDCTLYPVAGSLDYGSPQVDANPAGSPPPRGMAGTVEVRLEVLAIAPDVRVDILACAPRSATPYCATTVVGAVPDVVVWSGDLQGVIDIYIWTSPFDSTRAPHTLADLLPPESSDVAKAMIAGSDDQAPSSLSSGASMQLAALARASLRRRFREVATAFHGSFGAEDRGTTCTTPAVSLAIGIKRGG